MSIEIHPLDQTQIQRRCVDGQLWDMVDYPFLVSNGEMKYTVKVGITGMFHDPAEALGSKRLSQNELAQAASAWLRSRISKGECDPFGRPQTDCLIEVPSSVMDYWSEHRMIPTWL